jgi:hypothetical protein
VSDLDELAEGQFRLVLTKGGGAELEDDSGEVIWSSDDDEAFEDAGFSDFLGEADIEKLLRYLVNAGELEEGEADECEVCQETGMLEASDEAGDEGGDEG